MIQRYHIEQAIHQDMSNLNDSGTTSFYSARVSSAYDISRSVDIDDDDNAIANANSPPPPPPPSSSTSQDSPTLTKRPRLTPRELLKECNLAHRTHPLRASELLALKLPLWERFKERLVYARARVGATVQAARPRRWRQAGQAPEAAFEVRHREVVLGRRAKLLIEEAEQMDGELDELREALQGFVQSSKGELVGTPASVGFYELRRCRAHEAEVAAGVPGSGSRCAWD
jgi:hypothetical protein